MTKNAAIPTRVVSAELPSSSKEKMAEVTLNSREQLQAQHTALVSLIISKTAIINKEIGPRNRRMRDVYIKLNAVIEKLEEFKNVAWPHNPAQPPQWMFVKNKESTNDSSKAYESAIKIPDGTSVVSDLESVAETITTTAESALDESNGDEGPPGDAADDFMKVENEENDQEGVEEGSENNTSETESNDDGEGVGREIDAAFVTDTDTVVAARDNDESSSKVSMECDHEDNDPKVINEQKYEGTIENGVISRNVTADSITSTTESVEATNPAIVSTVSTYCDLLKHPNHTPKMAQLSLDCTNLLITNKYVVGCAKKRDDKEKSFTGNEDQFQLIDLVETICACADSTYVAVQTSMMKALLALITSTKCRIHEAAMLKAVRACFHIYLVTKDGNSRAVSKASLLDMLRCVFSRMEASNNIVEKESLMKGSTFCEAKDGDTKEEGELNKSQENDSSTCDHINMQIGMLKKSNFISQFQTDGYLLFRALCKLSAKPLSGEIADIPNAGNTHLKINIFSGNNHAVDPLALKSKVLSLELILSVFEHCGPCFQNSDKFIYALQNYLCVSLLKNCMSNHIDVAKLSLKIFLVLVYKFKTHLKAEIEIFVSKIFLVVLESENSPFEQKKLVLETLRVLCSDPQVLTQIFLNYDCDFDAVNLFKTIVQYLTTLSVKPRFAQSSTTKNLTQDFSLSASGLEVLVGILQAFLKALNLPGGDDSIDVTDIGDIHERFKIDFLESKTPVNGKSVISTKALSDIPEQDDMSVTAKDVMKMENADNSPDIGSVAGKIVDAFDRKRTAQQNFETGSVKFKLSFKQGILFFIESGFIHLDARELAVLFLEHKDHLDKTQIGEVLGKEPEASFVKDKDADPEKGGVGFYVRVLYHYVDAMNFSGMEFDGAIREFLSGFRLPGEAQKIDRIMEKFAERYTRQNEDVFASADTAFILAFSVIMLQTDLHNPSIKPERRMTVDSFISNNRGINVDGGDLPKDFLKGIFERIKAKPFSLKEDDEARKVQNKNGGEMFENPFLLETSVFFTGNLEERKRERFKKERAEIMASSEKLIKNRPSKNLSSNNSNISVSTQLTESISPADVVKPMFDVLWGPLIGSLSQILEMSHDDRSIALCLNGIIYSVRISSHSEMSLARDTFITSLAKFTTLGSIKEMKSKNIDCIRTLLSIAIIDGDRLGKSWGPVLQCISQLSRLQLFASGLASDDALFLRQSKEKELNVSEHGGFFKQVSKEETERETEEINGKVILETINEVLIEKVFSSTVKLSSMGIVDFVECLVAVSDTEIEGDSKKGISGFSQAKDIYFSQESEGRNSRNSRTSGPRMFSVQKLVEVAYLNMNVRPRLAWAQMWEQMAEHFVKIGSHPNTMVSMFAIDSLRQLSIKFLEKPELTDFSFQRKFLGPFLEIMENPDSSEEIRELVLRCVDNIIRTMSHNLRSGWKIFFCILAISAEDSSEKISTLGLAILQRLMDQHLGEICNFDKSNGSGEFLLEKEMSKLERKEQNANAEDFIDLCRASLAFVPVEETHKPIPIGLSMRALCHFACYADLIAEGNVLPPVSCAQIDDPKSFGYTYPSLIGCEAEEMVLWRILLDGLGKGISSLRLSNSGGVGCLIQRASLITLRAILLRHGQCFSVAQWSVILDYVILPAVQIPAAYDVSQVPKIVSETPFVSNIDFLSEPLELPPSPEDSSLLKFSNIARNDESSYVRPLGKAEVLVEASFADLRNGGEGNIGLALDAKDENQLSGKIEQPFPDSWIATTSPLSLGMLTDIFSLFLVKPDNTYRKVIWPKLMIPFESWLTGEPYTNISRDANYLGLQLPESIHKCERSSCEALARISCKEIFRLSRALLYNINCMEDSEQVSWIMTLCSKLSTIITRSAQVENTQYQNILNLVSSDDFLLQNEAFEINNGASTTIPTIFGAGKIIEERKDIYDDGNAVVNTYVLDLGSGVTMYCSNDREGPDLQYTTKNHVDNNNVTKALPVSEFLEGFIMPLKVSCITSHCMLRGIASLIDLIGCKAGRSGSSDLLSALENSRSIAEKASVDKKVEKVFQQAMIMDLEENLDNMNSAVVKMVGPHSRGSSGMFFLSQAADANNAMIKLLSIFFCANTDSFGDKASTWDSQEYAGNMLINLMLDVLQKFLVSEDRERSSIDPNVWRNSSESGGKIALYCTSFAFVVVNILKSIIDFSPDKFQSYLGQFYPILCKLIRVESEEIRILVSEIMMRKVSIAIRLGQN
mmetsp:Transcript_16189/g.23055  ORF Transcript_16189/g.23055 Transcript_16189/m.23055 type:complete len:2231 (+) Transcript_16189:25-6717(+)